MSKTNKLNGVFRRMSRAFTTKDEKAFEDAMDALEERLGDEAEEEPDTIEVHNHIPDSMSDTSRGELPEKDPAGFDRRGRDAEEEEAPPWFKKHAEATDARFKKMGDSIENLLKGKKGGEEEGSSDRHNSDEVEGEEERRREEPDENLEMDRRNNDRNRDRRNEDEANKEILGELEFEAPPGTGDRARKARDSAFLEDAFQDAVSKAEVLAPGITVPSFDKKASPSKTFRAIDTLRKTALDLAYNKADTRGVIDQAMSGRTLDSKVMSFGARRVLFNAAASQVGDGNNRRATDRTISTNNGGHRPAGNIQSIADINKVNRERFARR
jgi:hypothetical protein